MRFKVVLVFHVTILLHDQPNLRLERCLCALQACSDVYWDGPEIGPIDVPQHGLRGVKGRCCPDHRVRMPPGRNFLHALRLYLLIIKAGLPGRGFETAALV